MNEAPDSYFLIIETDETNALILGEALADWSLGVHLPDGAAPATLEIFCATRAEAESCLHALQTLAPQAHFGPATIKPVPRQDWAESWKRFFRGDASVWSGYEADQAIESETDQRGYNGAGEKHSASDGCAIV